MKKLFYIFSIIAISSCWHRPEQPSETPEEQYARTDGRSGLPLPEIYTHGVWVTDSVTRPISYKCDVADSIGTDLVRYDLFMPTFLKTGTDKGYIDYANRGKEVILNIDYRTGFGKTPQPVPNMDTFKIQFEVVLRWAVSIKKPVLVVFSNEENNTANYHKWSMDYYCDLLEAAIMIGEEYGVTVVNGGIASYGLNLWYNRQVEGKVLTVQGRRVDTLLRRYAVMPGLKYVNLHTYAMNYKEANNMAPIRCWVDSITQRPTISNETGQRVIRDSALTTVILNAWKNTDWFIFFSGNPKGEKYPAIPLHNADKSLNDAGICYKNFIQQ